MRLLRRRRVVLPASATTYYRSGEHLVTKLTFASYAWIWMESITSQQFVLVPSNAVHGSVSAVVLNMLIQPVQRLGFPGTVAKSNSWTQQAKML